MSCEATPHVGQVGLALVVEFIDSADETAIDVSTSTVRYIYLTSPSGVTTRKTAALDTTGADGKIRYTTASDADLNEPGVWLIQGYVEIASEKFSGAESSFEVNPSRHADYTP